MNLSGQKVCTLRFFAGYLGYNKKSRINSLDIDQRKYGTQKGNKNIYAFMQWRWRMNKNHLYSDGGDDKTGGRKWTLTFKLLCLRVFDISKKYKTIYLSDIWDWLKFPHFFFNSAIFKIK